MARRKWLVFNVDSLPMKVMFRILVHGWFCCDIGTTSTRPTLPGLCRDASVERAEAS